MQTLGLWWLGHLARIRNVPLMVTSYVHWQDKVRQNFKTFSIPETSRPNSAACEETSVLTIFGGKY